MIRMLIRGGIHLLASAIGLIVAAVILEGVTLNVSGFIIAVVLFTVVELIADPLITKIAIRHATALRGGTSLVSVLIGLIVTTIVSNGLNISGATDWILATLIVWLATMLAAWILPFFLLKKVVDNRQN
jgi:putative membrane protein